MAEIVYNRTIRPSTRKKTSFNYRVNVERVLKDDNLIVNITHESKPFRKTFRFRGQDVANRNNISFRVLEHANGIDIIWSGAQPVNQ